MNNLAEAIKALKITDDTVLFVDMEQIEVNCLLNCESIPKGTLIVSVVGPPNVEAMTQEELVYILNRKIAKSKESK